MTTFTHINPESRKNNLWGTYWAKGQEEKWDTPLFLSESDVGVMRNLGRNGSRFGAKAICTVLKTRQITTFHSIPTILPISITNLKNEFEDYDAAQLNSQKKIEQFFSKKMVHLGGGHDHIYPLLKSFESNVSSLLIINIDAHCDTRTDQLPHSGNPFSRFAKNTSIPFHLVQWGIHSSSNSKDTLESIDQKQMTIFQRSSLDLDKLRQLLSNYTDGELGVVLSLDADALASTQMEAVSAVNPWGIELIEVIEIIKLVKNTLNSKTMALGIYEYNPLYDNLSQKGARSLSLLIEEFLK